MKTSTGEQRPIAITNVRLTDGIDAPQHADVLIANGRFAAFAPPGEMDVTDVEIVSGDGRFLVPGLWEGHTHMMMGVDGSASEKVASVKAGLQSYLTRGITGVVDLGCPVDVMTAVRSEIADQPASYPAFRFAGPVFTGVHGWPLCLTCDHSSAFEITPDSPVETMVEGLGDKTDFIKVIYDGLPGGTDKFPSVALKRVIGAAHANGKRTMVHVRSKTDVVEAVRAGAGGIEHIFQPEHPARFDEAEEAAALMAEYGVFWCPTLVTYEQIGHLGSILYLEHLRKDGIVTLGEMMMIKLNPFYNRSFPRVSTEEALARLDYANATLPLFAQAGVRIVAGSDVAIAMSRPGALLRELQLLGRAGLDPAAVIRSATVNAADRLGLPDTTSRLAPGAPADAILVNADPLASIDALVRTEHVEMVFKDGVPVAGR